MNKTALQLVNLHRSYQQGDSTLNVLCGVDLHLEQGEIVALLGPSGSGKSTLLHIAGLLENPDKGAVHLNGTHVPHDAHQRTLMRRRGIGFVYQFHNLLPEFTALENVMIPARIDGAAKSDAAARAETLLDALNVGARAHHQPGEMSGGEQQRVAIARALMNTPTLILADEPTGSLDGQTGTQVFEMLMRHARAHKAAVLVATHNVGFAKTTDRILTLRDGVVVAG